MSTLYYESSLAHHGIKGQKWGVRRTPEQLGHKRPAKDISKAGYSHPYNSKEWKYRQIDDSTLPKGYLLYRTTDAKHESKHGRKYASFTPRDISRYQSEFYKRYQTEYTLNKDIKIAGGLTAFSTLMSNNGMFKKPLKDVIDPEWAENFDNPEWTKLMDPGYAKIIKDNQNKTLKEVYDSIGKDKKSISNFFQFYGDVQGHDDNDKHNLNPVEKNRTNENYFKLLKKAGYDAVIDLEDALTETEYPIILLNEKSYKVTNVSDSYTNKGQSEIDRAIHNNENRKRQKE